MSNAISTTTTAIAFRLPNYVYTIEKRRADKQGIKVSEYLKRKTTYDALRKR